LTDGGADVCDATGFEGHEFYFEEFPELHGKTFAEVRAMLPTSNDRDSLRTDSDSVTA
jgi:hypothetical protein